MSGDGSCRPDLPPRVTEKTVRICPSKKRVLSGLTVTGPTDVLTRRASEGFLWITVEVVRPLLEKGLGDVSPYLTKEVVRNCFPGCP